MKVRGLDLKFLAAWPDDVGSKARRGLWLLRLALTSAGRLSFLCGLFREVGRG